MFYHNSIERWVGKIQIKSVFCKPGENFTPFKLCTLYFLCKQTLGFDNVLTPKSVIICQGEELFTSLMKSSINCWGLRKGRRGEWSREYNRRGGRIIVGNSFHFIKSWSPRRQGHSDERWEGRGGGGGSVEELIAGRNYYWAVSWGRTDERDEVVARLRMEVGLDHCKREAGVSRTEKVCAKICAGPVKMMVTNEHICFVVQKYS